MTNQLKVTGLQCERGEKVLFTDLSFTVESGQLCHIEGLNGSGKTTLLRTIAGYSLPYAGSINWNDQPATLANQAYTHAYRYIGHQNGLKSNLTARENLHFIQQLYNNSVSKNEISQALMRLDVSAQSEQLIQTLSQGQRRKVSLARLLLGQSALWILDEPFTSLDQQSNLLIETLMQDHLDQQGSIILATHQPLKRIKSKQIKSIGLNHE